MIRLQGVARSYHDGQTEMWALRDVDLFVPQGQTVALTGRSGSGKSTLLHLIAGLDLPTAGSVVVGTTRLDTLSDDRRTDFRLRTVGLVFQFFHLLPGLTVAENVMFPAGLAGWSRKRARARSLELLASFGMDNRADAFPERLSGGEQQRIAIARSLILEPPLLLADEPTGNLDAESSETVAELLFGLARSRRMTLILATHSADLARQTDRILTLRAGRIDGDSRPLEVPPRT